MKLDLKPFIDAWGSAVTFKVGAPDGSLHFCGVDVAPSAAGTIQTNDVYTTTGDPLYAADFVEMQQGEAQIAPADYLGNGNEPGVLAFEAVKTYGKPKLSVLLGETSVLEFELPLSLSSVKDMYRWLNIRSACGDSSGEPSSLGPPGNFPDDECDGRHFVFVHGYNVNPAQARVWADAMFKRLWWSGSKSRFTAVDWRGDESQFSTLMHGDVSPDYYANVRNAFMSAPAFVQGCGALAGTKTLLAHSLGNMLVSSAVKDCGLTGYAKYYMLNAAVPMEAYDVAADEPMRGGLPLRSGGGCQCGCQSFSSNTVSHASSCLCSECSASGDYGYEGYVEHFDIPFPGDGGGGDDPPEPPDPPEPDAPSVSVSFEKPVVIFEDSYEDSPGVFVPRRSTTTKLTVTAYGGENGGTLSLSVVGGLDRCAGQSGLPGYVPPGQTIEWEANYEGIAASASQGGAVATVTFTDSVTGLDTSGAANATVVEIKLHPKISVGNRPYRHAIGVCEAIDCLHEPSSFPIDWESTGDGIIIEENGETVFVAPVKGNSAQIVARKGNVMLPSDMTIAEPEGLLCSNVVTVIISAVPQGATGGVGMNLHLYVLPLTVSFANIAVEEVPCLTGTHFGYFTNSIFSGRWSHTYDMGAGRWRNVGSGNYYGPDASTSGDWPSPWSWGLMTWDIPIGWTYANPDEGDPQEKNFPVQYLSTWTLEADGTISKSKHGHTVSRTTNDIIRLDGVIINGN